MENLKEKVALNKAIDEISSGNEELRGLLNELQSLDVAGTLDAEVIVSKRPETETNQEKDEEIEAKNKTENIVKPTKKEEGLDASKKRIAQKQEEPEADRYSSIKTAEDEDKEEAAFIFVEGINNDGIINTVENKKDNNTGTTGARDLIPSALVDLGNGEHTLTHNSYVDSDKVFVNATSNSVNVSGSVKMEYIFDNIAQVAHTGKVAIYARVSSSENQASLDNQTERLTQYAILRGYNIVQTVMEIGSGINDKRPKLEKLLRSSGYSKIIVEHKDRLTRFGFNYLETLLSTKGIEIEVVNPSANDETNLMEDLVSIIYSFLTRIYGLSRSTRKTEKIIEILNKKDDVV